MAWEDNYSTLFTEKLPLEGNKEWKFSLEEHKKRGTLQINMRVFQNAKVEGGYEGPTKNGAIIPITTLEDLEDFQNTINKVIDKVKDMM